MRHHTSSLAGLHDTRVTSTTLYTMKHAFVILSALVAVCFAARSHDNTIGVTECHDGLREIYHKYTSAPDCYRARKLLDDTLSICRPSDPVQAIALLKDLVNSRDCSETKSDLADCSEWLGCLNKMTPDQWSLDACSNSGKKSGAMECLRKSAYVGCEVARKVRFMLKNTAERRCNGEFCYMNKAIFQAIPGSQCSTIRSTIVASGWSYEFSTIRGVTMFNTDTCRPAHYSEKSCLN